jgi:ribonuclease HII
MPVTGPKVQPPTTGRPTLDAERRLWKEGVEWVAGLDEVGRGSWAGPLTVGVAVVRPGVRRNSFPKWLRDSKMLTEERREEIFDDVAAWCADWAVGHASPAECDRWGMTAAQCLASRRALEALELAPEAALVDGPRDFTGPPPPRVVQRTLPFGGEDPEPLDAESFVTPEMPMPSRVQPIVKGDARCASIAAASVLAKVTRDRIMRAESEHYACYHFEDNKGYPSPLHKIALRGYGLSVIHRRTWAFVEGLVWR